MTSTSTSDPVAPTEALIAVTKLISTNVSHYHQLGAQPPTNLLLCGPPGIGKTHAVRTVANRFSIPLFAVKPGPNLRRSLLSAFSHHNTDTSIVFIDEIDIICPAKDSPNSTPSHSSLTLLLSLIDPPPNQCKWGSKRRNQTVFIIAATNRPNSIHPTLRRAGRFDREARLTPPTNEARLQILQALQPNLDKKLLQTIANRTTAFVTADLVTLCKTATRFLTPPTNTPSEQHFLQALRHTTPSLLRRDIATIPPNTSWNHIAGVSHVKKRLQIAVEWPLRYSSTFNRLSLRPPRGILLHGPPGCSKTSLVRAAASHSHASFIRMNGADIYSCYVGEAESILRDAFSLARAAAPSILFLDEIDAIVGKRSLSMVDGNPVQQRVLSTLLTEMDGIVVANNVLVIGATNRVDLLDDALLRPGRFDEIIKVDLPDENDRMQILQLYTRKLPVADDVDLNYMAGVTNGCSGADLKGLCSEAALRCLREYRHSHALNDDDKLSEDDIVVNMKHFNINKITTNI